MHNPLPKITFIIVKKRHNTRFFIQELGQNPHMRVINNVQPGRFIALFPSEIYYYL